MICSSACTIASTICSTVYFSHLLPSSAIFLCSLWALFWRVLFLCVRNSTCLLTATLGALRSRDIPVLVSTSFTAKHLIGARWSEVAPTVQTPHTLLSSASSDTVTGRTKPTTLPPLLNTIALPLSPMSTE